MLGCWYRELEDVLGLTEMAGDVLADARSGKNGRHALAGLFRQSVFGRLAGYGWDDVLKPVVARYQGKVSRIYFRVDAAFAMPEVYEFSKRSGSSMRSGCRPTKSC